MTEIVIIVMKYIHPQSNAHRGRSNDSYQRASATPWMIERGKNCSLDFTGTRHIATHRERRVVDEPNARAFPTMQRLLPVVSAAALRESSTATTTTTTTTRDDDGLGNESTSITTSSSSSSRLTGKENDATTTTPTKKDDKIYKSRGVRNGPTKRMDRREPTRLALSPLVNANEETRANSSRGATTTTTPLRRVRSLMAAAAVAAMGTGGEETCANRQGDGYAAALQVIKDKFETRERELVRFMREMARRADVQSEELRDALDALAAAEEEHEKALKEIADARASERDALEYSILLENKERLAERDKAAALASRLADRDEEISALNDEIHRLTDRLSSVAKAESESRAKPQTTSAAARYAVANLRSEIRDLLRDELRAEIAAEIVASAGKPQR